MTINVKRLKNEAVLPSFAYEGDAGLSLHCLEDKTLAPGERYRFDLGWALEFDPEYVALVLDRGSMGVVNGLKTMGGVFDSNYRGEYNVCLVNLSSKPYDVKKGDKIAQLVIVHIQTPAIKEVSALSETVRGAQSMGSSGR